MYVLITTHKSLGFPWLLFVVFSAFLAGSITKVKAGTVTFSDRAGSYFNFKNISEYGPSIPPSILDLPTLISNAPYDSITFQPTAFVAVESNLGIRESSTLGSNLQFTVASRSLFGIENFKIALAGTFAGANMPVPGTLVEVAALLPIQLTYGGVSKSLNLNIAQDSVNKTWSGELMVTRANLNSYFNPPSMQITELMVLVSPSVTATAVFGNARSQITNLTFQAQAIPEPSTGSLLMVGTLLALVTLRPRPARACLSRD
jgi:hypothetical protein